MTHVTDRSAGRRGLLPHQRAKILPTVVLLIGAFYALVPVAWVVSAATKSSAELFSTFTFPPRGPATACSTPEPARRCAR